MKLKKILSLVVAGVTAATMAVSASADNNAGLTFQTGTYGFRDTINQSAAYWWNVDQDAEEYDTWNYTDTEITKNGQYKVSFEKDDSDGAVSWNMLKLIFLISETDYPDFAVTIDSFKIDGTEISSATEATLGTEEIKPNDYSDSDFEGKTDYYVVGFYNTYNADQQFIKSDDYGQKVEVIFTVSGYEEGDGVPATIAEEDEAPADDAETPADDAETPADDAEAPADDTEAPADDAEAPADDSEVSTEVANTTTESSSSSSSSDNGWVVWVIIGAVVVVAVIVIIVVVSKKKK